MKTLVIALSALLMLAPAAAMARGHSSGHHSRHHASSGHHGHGHHGGHRRR